MFGYFRFNQLYASPRVRRVYKNYYCGTCFALEYNYGEISRFILSYDVVILALLARLHKNSTADILPCFLRKKEKKQFYNDEGWKKLSAINILLMKAKLDDDINDEKAVKAKATYVVFGRAIKKAEKEYPKLAAIIKNGYKRIFELEMSGADILDICDEFAELMMKLAFEAYRIDDDRLEFLRVISRWLYFIDQLDDYDDDVIEGKYNPLVREGISKTQMIDKDHNALFSYFKNLFCDFERV